MLHIQVSILLAQEEMILMLPPVEEVPFKIFLPPSVGLIPGSFFDSSRGSHLNPPNPLEGIIRQLNAWGYEMEKQLRELSIRNAALEHENNVLKHENLREENEPIQVKMFRLFFENFWQISDSFEGGNIRSLYYPLQKNRKFAQKVQKRDRKFLLG